MELNQLTTELTGLPTALYFWTETAFQQKVFRQLVKKKESILGLTDCNNSSHYTESLGCC